jgi:hypothetical protein
MRNARQRLDHHLPTRATRHPTTSACSTCYLLPGSSSSHTCPFGSSTHHCALHITARFNLGPSIRVSRTCCYTPWYSFSPIVPGAVSESHSAASVACPYRSSYTSAARSSWARSARSATPRRVHRPIGFIYPSHCRTNSPDCQNCHPLPTSVRPVFRDHAFHVGFMCSWYAHSKPRAS